MTLTDFKIWLRIQIEASEEELERAEENNIVDSMINDKTRSRLKALKEVRELINRVKE